MQHVGIGTVVGYPRAGLRRMTKMYGLNHQHTVFAGLKDWYTTTGGNMEAAAHWLRGAYGLDSATAGEALLDYQNKVQDNH